MPGWALIVIIVVVVAAVVVAALAMQRQRRTRSLRERFGPEYERTVERTSDRRGAEKELDERRRRRESLDIRPLDPEARTRYAESWRGIQSRFVDSPQTALAEADVLVMQVMRDRGYPTDDFDQRAADVSVDHPVVVENYRAAHAIARSNDRGEAATEDLRQAIVHYRALFEDLLNDRDGDTDRAGRREVG